jgi:tripartite-type tricarboxylate transporter receptor subunit TctC
MAAYPKEEPIMTQNRRSLLAVASLAVLTLAAGTPPPAAAQKWPDKPIRVIVPYPAGGAADAIARAIGPGLGDLLGQPIVVENRGGASGTIGADMVAKAAPDGYTLMVTPTTQPTNTTLDPPAPYRADRDFMPIIGITLTPLVYAAGTSFKGEGFAAFRQASASGKLTYGSYGQGTSTHIMLAILSEQLNMGMTHVPYKGESPMVTDLLAGTIDSGMVSIGLTLAHAGKIKPLALLGTSRSSYVPGVPTFNELGVKGLDWDLGVGLYAPSKVPAEIIARLEAEMQKVLKREDVLKALGQRSYEPWGLASKALHRQMIEDMQRWDALGEKAKALR